MRRRVARFYAVGAMGIAVQLGALALLKGALGWHPLAATACAVEIAVLHNFVWHEQWTWADRGRSGVAARLARFHLSAGFVSIVLNLAAMQALGVWMGVPYLISNGVAIGCASLVNFALSEVFVFRAV